VLLGQEYQAVAKKYFDSVFEYYRNYVAHDGSRIGEKEALRCLIVSTELLEMIAASERSLAREGGVEVLIESGLFMSYHQLESALLLLLNYQTTDDAFDNLFEGIAKMGVTNEAYEALFDFGLVECVTTSTAPDVQLEWGVYTIIETHLIDLGKKVLSQAKNLRLSEMLSMQAPDSND
jgi:hypothetical protein